MLFPTLSVSVLGFAAVSYAAPQLHSRFATDAAKREAIMPVERGLTWTPKKRQNNIGAIANFNSFSNVGFSQDFNSFQQETVIVINQLSGAEILAQQQLQQEQELVGLIQEQLFLLQSQNFISDNIRKNHFNSKNSNVNTVILIVQQVNDNRSGKSNTRYMTRQLQSNSNNNNQEVIIIQEENVLNVGGQNNVPSSVSSAFGAQASGGAQLNGQDQASNIGTYQPGLTQFQGLNSNMDLLPAGLSGFPQFNFGTQDVDPALIILQNQQAEVVFLDQSQSNEDNNISEGEIISIGNQNSNII